MPPTPDRRTFQDPPLKEAVLEFRFLPGEREWDSIMLGKIHDRIEDRFPKASRPQSGSGIRIQAGGGNQQISIGGIEDPIRRFASEDESEVVTAGPGLLGVSELPRGSESGYPGWERMYRLATSVLETYREVVKPGPVARIGVRYINEMKMTEPRSELGHYIDPDANLVPPILLEKAEPCGCRLDHSVSHEVRERLNVGIEIRDGDEGIAKMLTVDIDEVYDPDEPSMLSEDLVRNTCDRLHEQAYQIFMTIMSDDLLEEFGPITPKAEGIK